MQFAAVQLNEGETYHKAIEALMRTAVATRTPFGQLEVLGVMTVGSSKFVRFRTDLFGLTTLKTLLQLGRGIIHQEASGYVVQMGGRTGKIAASTMQAGALPGDRRTYRGPSIQHWERQFL